MKPARTMAAIGRIAGLVASLAAGSAAAKAQGASEPLAAPGPAEQATWTFVWENDYFAGTDRNYTNGVRLSYLSGGKTPQGLSQWVAQNVFGADDPTRIRRGFAIGHSIFTPRDTEVATPLPDQHPYAGWLYGEYLVVVEQNNLIDQITVQAGVVGPSAGAEFVQNNWHDLIDDDPVNGWDNQLDDEFGLVLSYERKWRREKPVGTAVNVDVMPSVGASLGNVFTDARAGLTVRVGTNLQDDYGPPRVRPSLAGGSYFTPSRSFGWYVFAGAEARVVAHNIFLDGSLFRSDDPSVRSRTLVGDFQAGLAVQLGDVQLAYTYVVRTKEFDTQQGTQQFGAISLSAKF